MTMTLTLARALRNSFVAVLLAALVAGAAADPLPHRYVIVASHKLATDAGLEMLRKGGSAVDAAIAAQMVLGLVEPQSSGIGGGTFLVHWTQKKHRLETYDGRETAPKSVTPNQFVGAGGKPLGYIEAVIGGKSVGIPGTIAVLWLAHKEHGKLKWADLFAPAIALAESGFPVSRRMNYAIEHDPVLAKLPAAAYLMPNGKPLQVGDIVKNPAYAATLREIAVKGPDGFYRGRIAQAIADTVTNAPHNAMPFTLADLASYRAKKRAPVCGTYRTYNVCGMGPPSSGGITALQTLKMLERFDIAQLKPSSPQAIHLITEAERLAFADRNTYIGDADFVRVPIAGMTAPNYLRSRSQALSLTNIIDRATIKAGTPKGANLTLKSLEDRSRPGTAHMSIIDGAGNALAMTTTVEGPFGSHLLTEGFFLNNQLTDFSFVPHEDNRFVANAPMAGKRPMSSMTPTIIFDRKGKVFAVLGSPGGWRIIPYVTKTIVALIDWHMSMADAIAEPYVATRGGPTELEKDRLEPAADALRALGHDVALPDLGIAVSGLNAIRVTKEGFDAAADKRREGTVGGD